ARTRTARPATPLDRAAHRPGRARSDPAPDGLRRRACWTARARARALTVALSRMAQQVGASDSGMMACVASPHSSDPRSRPIGVFDSGVGGLTVLHELLVRLPCEDFLYLGDTARFPYGERSPEELARFASEIAEELLRRRAKLLVIACNSATAAALPILERRMMETVLGVVRPEALRAVAATRNGRIGLLATPTTVASGSYERAVGAVDPHVTLHAV